MNWKDFLGFIQSLLRLFRGGKTPPADPKPNPKPDPDPAPPSGGPEGVRKEVFDLLNEARTTRSIDALTYNDKLDQAAEAHAVWMAENQTMSHEGKGGSKPADRVNDTGYSWRTAGENIAMGYNSPTAVMDGWMHSKGHRRNILSDSYEEVGIAAARGKNNRIYWVQVFAAPAGAANAAMIKEMSESGILIGEEVDENASLEL
jgi:uncharacterized protein YkwD